MTGLRTFVLKRKTDVTGLSGTGEVLSGVVLPSGRVVVEWHGEHPSITVHASMNAFEKIHVHGHPDDNAVLWTDTLYQRGQTDAILDAMENVPCASVGAKFAARPIPLADWTAPARIHPDGHNAYLDGYASKEPPP